MSDLIDRQAAIDLWHKYQPYIAVKAMEYDNALAELPSIQPERPKGKWIDYTEDGYVECPFCHSATNCDGNKDELHFCFSCGADMRGEQDDNRRL